MERESDSTGNPRSHQPLRDGDPRWPRTDMDSVSAKKEITPEERRKIMEQEPGENTGPTGF